MAEALKKKGILSRIKSLVAKTGRSIIWRGRPKDNDISEKIAKRFRRILMTSACCSVRIRSHRRI